MAIPKTFIRMARNGQLQYLLSNFSKELIENPSAMGKELNKLFSFWMNVKTESPEGLAFENHCHSHFSDGPELADVVDLLFERNIAFWSLTDHDNSNAFDSLAQGSYRLDKKYEIEVNPDGRSLTIYQDNKSVVMLRSLEYSSSKGHIGIHGFKGNFAKTNLSLEESIKRGLDGGAFAVINHPYAWSGVGFHGRDEIKKAIEWGAIGIEKSGAEGLPLLFSALKAEADAKRLGVPLITSGDSHSLRMYGLSGLTFGKEAYEQALISNARSPPEAIKTLITANRFGTYLNYITPRMIINSFSD